ncbi:unnamed protein product [Dibothriocephalus latus]|uniref:Uncharacterized protein n=1 Tax=Dibothriocephalus latus TaxID=60516 RepID=A0A3P7LSU9_DIBLA|nr:unnamed protein product [Dibothriocephalus latus]
MFTGSAPSGGGLLFLPPALLEWRQNVTRASSVEALNCLAKQLEAAVAWDKSIMKAYCFVDLTGLLVLVAAAIMNDLAGLNDVPYGAFPRATIRDHRPEQFEPFSTPAPETEYRRYKNHSHVLTD